MGTNSHNGRGRPRNRKLWRRVIRLADGGHKAWRIALEVGRRESTVQYILRHRSQP